MLETELRTWLILDNSSASELHLYPCRFCFGVLKKKIKKKTKRVGREEIDILHKVLLLFFETWFLHVTLAILELAL